MSVLSLSQVSFRYGAGPEVLRLKEFSVQPTERVFVFGPSGSGKSTLLNILAGVLPPTAGEVNLLGSSLLKKTQRERDRLRADHVGYIFQSFNLIPYLTIAENISMPCRVSPLRRSRLKLPMIQEIETYARFLGLENYLHKQVTDLSIGQQQRVAVARALMGNPEILIADEPTSSLDSDMVDRFMQLILKEHAEKKFALIFVSHDQRLQKYFDRQVSLPELNQAEKS
jgi:putative ABC transport system ATP-binding protein